MLASLQGKKNEVRVSFQEIGFVGDTSPACMRYRILNYRIFLEIHCAGCAACYLQSLKESL